ncbi:MAG: SAM-dependent methyltransferase [Alphaproteobacteria bacterium]|nr:SAM-dependent methyltransferase [Alphaproteobacteria bacterium]
MPRADIEEIRSFFAKLMAAASGSNDPRLERIFELVPREAFMGPGPWQIRAGQTYVETPSDNPAYLYQNVLVALDAERQINNGEPFLHARWLGLAAPQAGETVTHIGAGTGYYSAILSMLVLPEGAVMAYEIDERLAERARYNLKPFENVSLVGDSAVSTSLPPSDLIYVNAGIVEPPVNWLEALKPGGRLIVPLCQPQKAGVAMLITKRSGGFEAKPVMPVWFIPCIGASEIAANIGEPDMAKAWNIRSVHYTKLRAPDDTLVIEGKHIWFSSEAIER